MDSFAPFRNALAMYSQTAGMPAQAMQTIAMDKRQQEQQRMANALQTLQMEEFQRQTQKSRGIDNALSSLFRQRAPGTGPMRNVTEYQPGQMEARSPGYGEIQSRLAPYGMEGITAAEKFKPETVKPTEFERKLSLAGIDPSTPQGQQFVKDSILKPNTQVEVGVNMPKQEEEFRKGMGKFYAEEFTGMQKEGREAHINNARLDRAGSLAKRINTGALKPTGTAVKRIIKDLGFNPESLGMADDVGLAEALKGVAVDLTMDTVQRTKGAVSNKEMELFAQVAPQLSNTVEGNLLIIEMAKTLNKNKVKVAEMARQYLRGNGRYDEGFYDELDKFYNENPLFTEDIYQRVNQLAGAANEAQERNLIPGAVDMSSVSDDDILGQLGIK